MSKRRAGWIRNVAGGDVAAFSSSGQKETRVQYEVDRIETRVIVGGAANNTWTGVDLSSWVPPGITKAAMSIQPASNQLVSFRVPGLGSAGFTRALSSLNAPVGGNFLVQSEMSCDLSQEIEYTGEGASAVLSLFVVGYKDGRG